MHFMSKVTLILGWLNQCSFIALGRYNSCSNHNSLGGGTDGNIMSKQQAVLSHKGISYNNNTFHRAQLDRKTCRVPRKFD